MIGSSTVALTCLARVASTPDSSFTWLTSIFEPPVLRSSMIEYVPLLLAVPETITEPLEKFVFASS